MVNSSKYNKSPKDNSLLMLLLLVGIIACITAASILDSQFRGEDELLTLQVATNLETSLRSGNVKSTISALLFDIHPPARSVVVVPFIQIFGANEFALRLPNVLLWVASCVVAAHIGWLLGGWWPGLISGMFLAVSGLFNLEANAVGHVGETLWILLMIAVLVQESKWDLALAESRKRYMLGSLYCAVGFLWFTSLLPVCGMYHVLWGFKALQRRMSGRDLAQYALLSLPWLGFYIAYYAVFMGVPAYLWYSGRLDGPVGQLGHTLGRAGKSHLNITSLQENLRALNWYTLPVIGWLLLAAGMLYQLRRYTALFVILIGYGALWSFYLSRNTAQHFLAYFCWLLPFGVVAGEQFLMRWSRNVFLAVFFCVLLVMSIWTYHMHIKTYSHETYPQDLRAKVWGKSLWQNNIERPMTEIARDIQHVLMENERFIVLSDKAFSLYYFPDKRYLKQVEADHLERHRTKDGTCLRLPIKLREKYNIRAAVAYTKQQFCESDGAKIFRYAGSALYLYVFPDTVN